MIIDIPFLFRVSGLRIRRARCSSDILKPLVIYPGGLDFRFAYEILFEAGEILRFQEQHVTFSELPVIGLNEQMLPEHHHHATTGRRVDSSGGSSGLNVGDNNLLFYPSRKRETVIDEEDQQQHVAALHLKMLLAGVAKRRQEAIEAAAAVKTEDALAAEYFTYILYKTDIEKAVVEISHVPYRIDIPALHVRFFTWL